MCVFCCENCLFLNFRGFIYLFIVETAEIGMYLEGSKYRNYVDISIFYSLIVLKIRTCPSFLAFMKAFLWDNWM